MARAKFEMYPKNGITEEFFMNAEKFNPRKILDKWGALGVNALIVATPRDTGKTAASWKYEIKNTQQGNWSLSFINDNVVDHVVIALILQYGHLTRSGSFVKGTNYINPAIQPIFDGLQYDLEKELSML